MVNGNQSVRSAIHSSGQTIDYVHCTHAHMQRIDILYTVNYISCTESGAVINAYMSNASLKWSTPTLKRYIPYHSHHHPTSTTGVLICMRDRARNICHPTKMQQEMHHLNHVFQANGFPETLVKMTSLQATQGLETQKQQEDAPKILLIPIHQWAKCEDRERLCSSGSKACLRINENSKKRADVSETRTPE